MQQQKTPDQLAVWVAGMLAGVQDFGDYFKAFCPAHDNTKTPALVVKIYDDGLGVRCHAGCETEDVLGAIGLRVPDILIGRDDAQIVDDQRDRSGARQEETDSSGAHERNRRNQGRTRKVGDAYEYRSADGNTLFRVLRTPDKRFFQQVPDGSGGWKNGLNGTKPFLYHLPDILARPKDKLFIVEGEKDADRLASLGLLATTSPMGAGKWREEYTSSLSGHKGAVYVIPDNDDVGRQHAEAIVAAIGGATLLRLPGLPEHGDVSDWLDGGGTKDKLLALAADAAPAPDFRVYSFADLLDEKFDPVRFIVQDLLPEGTSMLAGKPKMGKSWLAFGICFSVATGTKALKYFEVEQGNTLYLALEDNERRLQARGMKILHSLSPGGAGALDVSMLDYTTYAKRLDEGLIQYIQDWCESVDEPRLVVIDTIARIRSRNQQDKRQLYDKDYEVGELLTDLAAEQRIAIVPVGHTKKGEADDPLDLISGSTGLTGGMDGAMVLNRTRSAADAVLKGVHRELEHDPDYALLWNSEQGLWEYAGDAEEYRLSKERREILEVLGNADSPMQPKEIAEATDKLTPNVSRLLQKMRDDGQVDNAGWGKYLLAHNQQAPATFGDDVTTDTNGSDFFAE